MSSPSYSFISTVSTIPTTDSTFALNNDVKPPRQLTKTLLFAVFACTFGSSFQLGYQFASVNAPVKLTIEWFKQSHYSLWDETLSDEAAEFQWSIAVTALPVGAMIGALLSGWFADRIGRKRSLLFNNIIALSGGAFIVSAKPIGVYYLFTVGRLINGINTGLSGCIASLYLTEIAPSTLRGSIGSVHQLQIVVATFAAQIFGLPSLFGTAQRWPFIFAFTFVPVIVQLLTLPFCPESPKFTLINRGDTKQTGRNLKWLRASDNVNNEINELNVEAKQANSEPKVSVVDMLKAPFRWPLFVAVMVILSQQFTGINAVVFFSTKIFEDAGLKASAAIYATIVMAGLYVVQTAISVFLVDHPKFGRRVLHIGGLVGMFASTLLLTLALNFTADADGQYSAVIKNIASSASICFVITFVLAYATGPGSIPWLFIVEVFPSHARGIANSIGITILWTGCVLSTFTFLPITNLLGENSFLVFAIAQIYFIVFLWQRMPETKGKPLNQIQAELNC